MKKKQEKFKLINKECSFLKKSETRNSSKYSKNEKQEQICRRGKLKVGGVICEKGLGMVI